LPAAEAFFRRTINSTGCTPVHVATDKATFYPSAIRASASDAKHTATGFVAVPCLGPRLVGGRSYVRARHLAGIVNQLGHGL